jgi:RNA polymerase-associated protein RTF1
VRASDPTDHPPHLNPRTTRFRAPPFLAALQSDGEGSDGEDPNDPYGDGFGDDLMGDDDDRAKLSAMTELEREELLADRRDRRAQTRDRERIIQMAREKKAREAGGKKKFRQSDADAVTGRKSKRVAGEEATRGATDKSRALAEIARKKTTRGDAEEDRETDEDSDEYDDSDEEEVRDELDGISPVREKRKPTSTRARGKVKWGRRGGGSESDASDDASDASDDDDDDDGDGVPASEPQIRKMFLKRQALEKWVFEPYFAQFAPGCMVRIGIGVDTKTGDNRYRIAEIKAVAEGKHEGFHLREYELPAGAGGASAKRTPYWLVLKFGKHERAFKINEVSNGDPTSKEFAEWFAQLANDDRKPPRARDFIVASENIKAAERYRYTSEDVHLMLKKRQEKKGGFHVNLANQKEVLRRLIERAKAEGDDDAVARLSEQYEEVVRQLAIKLDKGGTQAIMANINKRNNQINDANLSRTAAEAIARAKSGKPDTSMNDPFQRRPTRMATYYTINGGEDAQGADATKRISLNANDDSFAPTALAIPRHAGETGDALDSTRGDVNAFANARSAKLANLKRAHAGVALRSIDPSLAASPDPIANAGIHPGVVPLIRRGMLGLSRGLLEDVRPSRPKGKTLTLEEYKVRQGVE